MRYLLAHKTLLQDVFWQALQVTCNVKLLRGVAGLTTLSRSRGRMLQTRIYIELWQWRPDI